MDYTDPMAQDLHYDWYLKEWLGTLNRTVAWLEKETGWTHRIASQLVNRQARWNRDHFSLAASILKIAPHELLMHPDDAMAQRRMKQSALTIAAQSKAAEERLPFTPAPEIDEPLRRAN